MKKTTTWPVPAVVVGAQQRADQQHRGAGGAHHAREQRAEASRPVLSAGVPCRLPRDVDAARDGEQREQQDDERHVFGQQRVQHLVQRPAPKPNCTANGTRKASAQNAGGLAEVVVPEGGRQQRQERDRQQDAGERHHPEQTQIGSIKMRSRAHARPLPPRWRGQD